MNKTEMINHIADQAGISKAQARLALHAYMNAVQTTLQKGGAVSLIGFGSFVVKRLSARISTNPRTLAPMPVPASKIPRFRAGKAFKNALNYS